MLGMVEELVYPPRKKPKITRPPAPQSPKLQVRDLIGKPRTKRRPKARPISPPAHPHKLSYGMRQGYVIHALSNRGVLTGFRCYLRPARIPDDVPPAIRSALPPVLELPCLLVEDAYMVIDALVVGDIEQLHSFKLEHPDHTWGFEDLLTQAGGGITEDSKKKAMQQAYDELLPCRLKATKRTRFSLAPTPYIGTGVPIVLAVYLCRVGDRDAWIEGTLYWRGTTLSVMRAVPDAMEQFIITEHHPGRYKGLGLDPDKVVTNLWGQVAKGTPIARVSRDEAPLLSMEMAKVVATRYRALLAQARRLSTPLETVP